MLRSSRYCRGAPRSPARPKTFATLPHLLTFRARVRLALLQARANFAPRARGRRNLQPEVGPPPGFTGRCSHPTAVGARFAENSGRMLGRTPRPAEQRRAIGAGRWMDAVTVEEVSVGDAGGSGRARGSAGERAGPGSRRGSEPGGDRVP